ncbi:MAG TPA: hypothetical protein VJ739_06320 [Gemmataceae bacterium]|nr:hypothetical protein [Gemmataceae bacterium]
MSTVAAPTVSEMILLAAWELEEQGQSPFSAEALIVTSWQKFPRAFGLKGYADQHPDSNKILASIMGRKGLTRRSLLVKMGQKLYALTREGRQAVRALQNADEERPAATEAVKLPRDQEKFLLALLASTALEKFKEGRRQELTFADACRFWGITENLHGEVLDARLDRAQSALASVRRLIGTGSAVLSNGRSVDTDEVAQLGQVHAYLEERFNRHLTVLRSRSGRN